MMAQLQEQFAPADASAKKLQRPWSAHSVNSHMSLQSQESQWSSQMEEGMAQQMVDSFVDSPMASNPVVKPIAFSDVLEEAAASEKEARTEASGYFGLAPGREVALKAGIGRVSPSNESAYACALQERLHKVQAEVETQGANALELRRKLDGARAEAHTNQEELAKLRAKWTDEQPQREALLRQTGEAERRLAEQERCCAEALSAHAAAELARPGGGSLSSSSAPAAAHAGPGKERQGSSSEKSSSQQPLGQQRQRLASLETLRLKLAEGLQELRDALRQEGSVIGQLGARSEALKKESRALQTGAEAARGNEARIRRKLEALDATASAAHPRQHALERQAADLRDEVQGLRMEFVSAAGATAPTEATGGAAVGPLAAWATNRRLQAKVASLQEELRLKVEHVQFLRHRSVRVSARSLDGHPVRAPDPKEAAAAQPKDIAKLDDGIGRAMPCAGGAEGGD
ncbi:unnamed protein product [Polarella glacialis]|uniref:Uncharacterized protein n=2 Tax=Polarella glacialis TaxID=89957 RepID=A0A813KY25_POLGL|nr:unnamed protein product [Polarella glacialis]